jgi:D-tyrosyl-tRNA(Tyr) deacylase
MLAVVQRVSSAHVEVDGSIVGCIGRGLLVLLGVERSDTEKDADYLAQKIVGLRIFNDAAGKMNVSVADTGGELLVVSQFTLCGDTRKGMRPSFDRAAAPHIARTLYEHFVEQCRTRVASVQTGVFQAAMAVHLINDGPVTLICESLRREKDL